MQDNLLRIPVLRLAGTGAITLAAVFAICWVALFMPFPTATHSYLGLFTGAEPRTGGALAEGLCWSLVFGFLVGGAGAVVFNLLGRSRDA